jgi:tripartite-type tricarboxylate transporter receptor subunit TctC
MQDERAGLTAVSRKTVTETNMQSDSASNAKSCARRQILVLLGAVAAAVRSPTASANTTWSPDRPVKLLIPYAPGGGADAAGRILAQALPAISGQPWVVENRPGAAGNIAADILHVSKPDGLTYQVTNLDTSVLNTYLYPSRKQRIEAAIPVAAIARIGTVLMTRPGLPVRDLSHLAAIAKTRSLNYASWGVGCSAHLGALLLEQDMKMPPMVHVPYPGGGQAMQALLKGEVDFFLAPMPLAMAHRSGGVGAVGYAAPQRSELWIDLPTLTEQGGPSVDLGNWFAISAPPRTPQATIDVVSDFIKKALSDARVIALLRAQSMSPLPADNRQLARFIAEEKKRWGEVIASAKIKLE